MKIKNNRCWYDWVKTLSETLTHIFCGWMDTLQLITQLQTRKSLNNQEYIIKPITVI